MDKIIQRARTAIATRKRKADLAKNSNPARFNGSAQDRISANSHRRIKAQAKRIQREDWRLGLLAPRRDVGAAKVSFGTVPQIMTSQPPGSVQAPFHEVNVGERVVILVGRERGKIGVVESVDEDYKTCTVKGYNKAYREVPEYLQEVLQENSGSVLVEMPYRLCDVRLVQRVGNRDVIVDYREKKYFLGKGNLSLIPGSTIEIDQPKKEPPKLVKHEVDTEIVDIEEATEIPELTSCPMPPSVIDELRNKYSRLRTRHDPEYVSRIEEKARFEAEQEDLRRRSAMTPSDELRLMWKLYRREPILTDDMLERIGRVMVAPVGQKAEVVRQLEAEQASKQGQSGA